MKSVYRILLAAAALCALGTIAVLAAGAPEATGPLVVGFFLTLAVGVRGLPVAREFAFTIWIFAAVSAAMFYPGYFQRVGDFELSSLIVPLIQLIMFGMGTAMSLGDFAGVVLIGSAPSGVASNVMAYIAGANLPLSVTLTAVSTLLAPIMTPFLMEMLAGQFVPVDFIDMMLGIINMVILPIGAGLLFNKLFSGKAQWLDEAMPIVSMVGIAVIITIITAAGRDSLLVVGAALVGAAVVHNAAGYLLGYWGCKLVGMPERDCRTIAIEVGMQNGGLASGIALQMGKVATVGLAPAIFGPWMNISGSALANYWRRTADELPSDREEVVAPAT